MPRDGSETYVLPFPDVEEDTTIESAVYNGFTNDVAQDLNTPRPVSSGGTGADNPLDAMQNLGGEAAKYQVTNYDAHPFQAGSFYSNAGATSAPTANAQIGICYVAVVGGSPTTDMFIEARDQVTGTQYVRQKKANVWQGWTIPAGFTTGPTPPAGSSPNTMWWDNTRGKLFIYYLDPSGAPAQWVEAVAVPDVDPTTFVEIAGDAMTGFLTLNANAVNPLHAVPKQQLDARFTGLYAAPFDAMAYNGMQINGSMEVSQEFGTSGTGANGGHAADGWKNYRSGTMVTFAATSTTAIVYGISNRLFVTVATAQASLGAGDYAMVQQSMEGYRISRLAWGSPVAQPLTIAFWSSHVRTGLYSGTVRNAAADRSYAFTYTHTTSSVAQYNVVTIPGDTSGIWLKDNSVGIHLVFSMGAGATFTAPSANTWLTGNYLAAPGQINAVAALTDSFQITGVVVLPGIEAPSAARSSLIMRPYDQELVMCQRYWEPLYFGGSLAQVLPSGQLTPGANYSYWSFHVRKRATPSLLAGSGATWGNASPGIISTSVDGSLFQNSTTFFYLQGTLNTIAITADARL